MYRDLAIFPRIPGLVYNSTFLLVNISTFVLVNNSTFVLVNNSTFLVVNNGMFLRLWPTHTSLHQISALLSSSVFPPYHSWFGEGGEDN